MLFHFEQSFTPRKKKPVVHSADQRAKKYLNHIVLKRFGLEGRLFLAKILQGDVNQDQPAFSNHLNNACVSEVAFINSLWNDLETVIPLGSADAVYEVVKPDGEVRLEGKYPVKNFPFFFNGVDPPTSEYGPKLHKKIVNMCTLMDKKNTKLTRPKLYATFEETHPNGLDMDVFPSLNTAISYSGIKTILYGAMGNVEIEVCSENLSIYEHSDVAKSFFSRREGLFPKIAVIECGFPPAANLKQEFILKRLELVLRAIQIESDDMFEMGDRLLKNTISFLSIVSDKSDPVTNLRREIASVASKLTIDSKSFNQDLIRALDVPVFHQEHDTFHSPGSIDRASFVRENVTPSVGEGNSDSSLESPMFPVDDTSPSKTLQVSPKKKKARVSDR